MTLTFFCGGYELVGLFLKKNNVFKQKYRIQPEYVVRFKNRIYKVFCKLQESNGLNTLTNIYYLLNN